MVIRVFRVQIDPEQRDAFEAGFRTTSVAAVTGQPGFIAAEIGWPTRWAPDEYIMISRWEDADSLRRFAGENWHEAVIPKSMAQFVVDCWVHHYEGEN